MQVEDRFLIDVLTNVDDRMHYMQESLKCGSFILFTFLVGETTQSNVKKSHLWLLMGQFTGKKESKLT